MTATQVTPTGQLSKWIEEYGSPWIGFVRIITQDLGIIKDARSNPNMGPGVAYYDQIHVWYKGETQMQEWQWRDAYLARNDRRDLRIAEIGNVTITNTTVRIELLNGVLVRTVEFTF